MQNAKNNSVPATKTLSPAAAPVTMIAAVPSEEDIDSSMPEKTDMVKVNFLLSRPLLLLDLLPKDRRSELSAHVGRHAMLGRAGHNSTTPPKK